MYHFGRCACTPPITSKSGYISFCCYQYICQRNTSWMLLHSSFQQQQIPRNLHKKQHRRGLLWVPSFKSSKSAATPCSSTHSSSTNDSSSADGSSSRRHKALQALHSHLADVTHMFTGATSALIQGADVPAPDTESLQVCVQWDLLEPLHARLTQQQLQPGPITRHQQGRLSFRVEIQGSPAVVSCQLNTVLRMDPNRILATNATQCDGHQMFWCESLTSVRQGACHELATAVSKQLGQLQAGLTAANGQVWSQAEAAGAWNNKLGPPKQTAQWICQDPWLRLGAPLFKHLPQQLTGLKLVNLMGSHGTKSVAAAVLGAEATCVDISPVNAAYGAQVAAAAGVHVDFVVADVLQLPPQLMTGCFDIVLLELGVLHYFVDLAPLAQVWTALLRPGGQLILREFHPISTKLITSKGSKHKVTGNYFSQDLVNSHVAYSKYTEGSTATSAPSGSGKKKFQGAAAAQAVGTVRLRQWTLGEVVTAVCDAGLVVKSLEEEPGVKADDAGLPKLFTLVATRSAA